MASSSSGGGGNGPRKLTIVVLIILVALSPVLIVSTLALGLQAPNPPPPANTSSVTATPTASGSNGSSTSSSTFPSGTTSSSTTGSTTTTVTTNSVTISGACENATAYQGIDSTSPPTTNSTTDTSFPIFSVKAGQTVVVCVAWVDSLPVATPLNITQGVSVGSYETQTFPNGTLKTEFIPATNVSVTPDHPTITLGGSAGPLLVVAYTIRTSPTAKGFYFMNVQGLYPTACDNEFRFAVGYAFTDANKSGPYFPLPSGMGACGSAGGVLGPAPPGGVYSQVYATSGIAVTNLSCGSFSCDLRQQDG